MKKIYLVLIFSLLTSTFYAQNAKFEKANLNWKTFDKNDQVSPNQLTSERKAEFGLSENDELLIKSQNIDDLAIEHHRYQQLHKGVRVEGSEYIIHRSEDKMWGNGRLVYGIESNSIPAISEAEALQNAMEYINAPKFYWEDESQEAFIKWFKEDPEATFYPSGELVFADEQFRQDGENYQLFWKFDIYAHGEKMREYVYVNANNGSIGHSRDAICYGSSEGTANTYYYGQQSIITDSIAPDSFRLVDLSRGGGVYTVNLDYNPPSYERMIGSASYFYDDDNNWAGAIEGSDPVATTAHWATEKTYDFYLEKYSRNSFDDDGAKMITGIHGGFNGNCIGFGFFSGMYVAIGDGPGCSYPGYFLEMVGHEFTHGVIGHSSAMEGGIESGALTESFCNILGTAIKFYANPDSANWEFRATFPYDMSDPNSGPYPRADTYLGNYWDMDGPYVKGSVQDYWYYLLSEGGIGVNDNGDSYNVEGIGMEKATDIAYRNLTLYLIPSTTFADARQGSILAAIDLYGECSNEVLQVINAWHAVGLGPEGYSDDLSLERIVSPAKDCGLTNSEIVEVEIKYHANGCNGVIQAGTEVELTYQVNNDPPVSETWVLADPLEEGESYFYSFANPINFPPIGDNIELSVWMDYAVDGISFNDALLDFEVGLKQTLNENVITFENGTDPETYYYVHSGENAVAGITSIAANSGTKGFSLSSGTSAPGTISADTSLNFDVQKSRISEICFCVDALDWETVSVNFDLKQTHSMLYNHFYGNDSTELVSSMRMMVNGEQFGAQFHPDTYLDDPYLSYSYSLDQFDLAGSNFEFCFQSKNQVNDEGDNSPFFPYDTDGDNTYLDNIRFADEEAVGVKEIENNDLTIYPNPTQGQVTINIGELKAVSIDVFGLNGRLVYHQENIIGPAHQFELIGAPGVYILELNALDKQKRFKLIKN